MNTARKTLSALVALLALVAGCADASQSPPATAAANNGITSNGGDSSSSSASSALETFTSDANAFDTHSYWLDTGREVVVFDAQFTDEWAKKLIAEIRAKTATPIRWVVITHPNPDKFNGAAAFQAIGAKVIASKSTANAIPGVHAYKKGYFVNVAKTFTDATYPAEAKIDVTFEGDYDLPLEGASGVSTSVKLHELKHRGVSSTQTVAFLPKLNAVVVGDLVHHKAHAWLEGGIIDGKPSPDIASWKEALSELSAGYPNAVVYGGRGEAAKVDVAVKAEQAYLDKLNAIVSTYVKGLGVAATNELSGANAGTHYKAIRLRAEQAYPDYALSYMIEYGVYGLALRNAL